MSGHVAGLWRPHVDPEGARQALHTPRATRPVIAAAGQHRPTPPMLRYERGGEVVFPSQVAILLSRPDEHFTGGENCSSNSDHGPSFRPPAAFLDAA